MNGPDGKPQFVQGGNSREFHSIPGVKGIKPVEIKEVPVDKYLNLIRTATPQDLKLQKKYMKQQDVAEGQGDQISKTKALSTLRKELMNSYEYMKSGNLTEFKQRLLWLSEGMLKNHITHVVNYVINMEEIELYQEYREKREQIQRGLTKGVSENFADGRNPQDKGDAKRHGVNTKGSISSLRNTAKQGGRKGELAHWMANMKSGRDKKNK
jgi:hypothetical protein